MTLRRFLVAAACALAAVPVPAGAAPLALHVSGNHLVDGSGQMRLVFFHYRAPEMQRRFVRGVVIAAWGESKDYGQHLQMVHPRV